MRLYYRKSRETAKGLSSLKWEIFMIIYLTKVDNFVRMAGMVLNSHDFFGLEATREACIAFLKSRLILANNRLVGIFFNSPLFSTGCPDFSMRNPL